MYTNSDKLRYTRDCVLKEILIRNISEERISSIIRVKRIWQVATTLAITSNWIVFLLYVIPLLIPVNTVPSSLILLTLKMEAITSSENSVLTRATQRHIPQ
jgi:hypothetical protein